MFSLGSNGISSISIKSTNSISQIGDPEQVADYHIGSNSNFKNTSFAQSPKKMNINKLGQTTTKPLDITYSKANTNETGFISTWFSVFSAINTFF